MEVDRQAVCLVGVCGEDPVNVAIKFDEITHPLNYSLVSSVKKMGTVLVNLNSCRGIWKAEGVASDVRSLFDNGGSQPVDASRDIGNDGTEEACSNNHKV